MSGCLRRRAQLIVLFCLYLQACTHTVRHAPALPTALHLPDQVLTAITSADVALQPEEVEVEPSLPLPAYVSTSPTIKVNLHVEHASLQEVLLGLARESGVNMDIHPGLTGVVSLHAVQQTIPAILARMARQADMRYEWLNGCWVISPDRPVIRTYRLDYVNLSRDTSGFIGAANEISGSQKSGGTTTTGSTTTGSNTAGASGSANSSRTAVHSQTRHHLWESVIENLKILLEETDKAMVVQRYGMGQSTVLATSQNQTEDQTTDKAAATSLPNLTVLSGNQPAEREQQRQEYTRWQSARLIANPESGILAIKATQRQHQQVKAYLQSVMRVVTRQVLIEASIVEVELNQSFQMGIDWSRMSAGAQQHGWAFAQSLGSKPAHFSGSSGSFEGNNTKNALGQNNGTSALWLSYINPVSSLGNLAASVTLLEQFGKARVLSSPKLMVLNNQPAVLKVVDNLVYFTLQSQISQSSGNAASNLQSVTTTANTVPVGLVMAVTAHINSKQQVNLHVRPTVSKVLRYVEDPNPQLGSGTSRIISSIPEIQVREIESVLHVPSGQIAVLGGLMQEDQRQLNERVPGLSNLPVLGAIFRGESKAARKTELVIFMRPTVIQSPDVKTGDLQAFAPLLPQDSASEARDDAKDEESEAP